VEGTLFGNGERTGNVDIVTVALNLYSQGIHPGLDFSNLNAVRDVYERCTRMDVPPRQPYAGDLVFTAFSGSHQDAINKGLAAQAKQAAADPGAIWDVPYLPIDPKDLGRNYRAIIRINSQSGKGGVAYVLEKEYELQLPKAMHRELGRIINDLADQKGLEVTPQEIFDAFRAEYIERASPLALVDFHEDVRDDRTVTCVADMVVHGTARQLRGRGNGPIDAFVRALIDASIAHFEILSYSEHSLGKGAEAGAMAYIQIKTGTGFTGYGAGTDTNIEIASIKAVVSALNRAAHRGALA
jgi:2-isopropylmalate synthase